MSEPYIAAKVALSFVMWAVIQHLLAPPLAKLAHRYLPPHIAEFLTKRRGD